MVHMQTKVMMPVEIPGDDFKSTELMKGENKWRELWGKLEE
jgi:hypothetical protein